LLSAEKQAKAELEEAKAKLKDNEEQLKRLESMANYEAVQRLKAAEETIKQMQKDLTHAKHVCEIVRDSHTLFDNSCLLG
jgi:multidrug resistance efflux pump